MIRWPSIADLLYQHHSQGFKRQTINIGHGKLQETHASNLFIDSINMKLFSSSPHAMLDRLLNCCTSVCLLEPFISNSTSDRQITVKVNKASSQGGDAGNLR